MLLPEAMAAIRIRFLERSRSELATLQAPGADPSERARIIHGIAGLAGVFGFHELSRAASRADQQMQEAGEVSGDGMADLIGALQAVLDDAR